MSDDTYLITADEIAAMEPLDKRHFLNPEARRLNTSLGDRTGLSRIGVHMIEVPPGHASTELHVHHHEEECLYVLSGFATAQIGEARHRVGPGDFIGYRAGGLPHRLVNDGDAPVKVLVMGQRTAFDVCDYPEAGKRMFRAEGLPTNIVEMEAIEEPSVGRKV